MVAKRFLTTLALFGVLGFAGSSASAADAFLDRMLNIFGITASPGQLRGDATVAAGQIWVADIASGRRRAVTADATYRWPIYDYPGTGVLALRGDALVSVSPSAPTATVVHRIPGIEKLIGFDRRDPDKILVVMDRADAPLASLSRKTGKLSFLPFDPKSDDHLRMLGHARGEERVYGEIRLKVERMTRETLAGPEEWTDVLLQGAGAPSRNISDCDGTPCGQPSLSADGRQITYVRAGTDR